MYTLFGQDERGFLLTDIGRLIYKLFEQRAEAMGFHRSQWRILGFVQNEPGIMQATLAERMDVEPITLSRQLDWLEKDQSVERRSDPRDRRVKRLFLLPKGEEQLAKLRALRLEIVLAMYKDVPEDEIERMRQTLHAIRRNLQDTMK